MLIALAGLPATGKSTIAESLRKELGGVILSKDDVRASLFPPPVLDFSQEQDDLCMAAIYQAAARIVQQFPRQPVILDGRTYLRAYQVHDLYEAAAIVKEKPRIIECVCDDATARERLASDATLGGHPAGNRSFTLYCELKAKAEPIAVPRLVLDTGQFSLEACVARCLEYLQDA